MITAITYRSKLNKKFVHPELTSESIYGRRIYGEQNTFDLQRHLELELMWAKQELELVSVLNADLLTCEIQEKIKKIFGYEADVSKISKHKRKYHICGLIIHEEDQTM